jgi:cell division septal protein FtsQ
MTQDGSYGRRGRGRSSFHALRLARRISYRTGRDTNRKSHQAAVRERRARVLVLLAAALGVELVAAALTSPILGIGRISVRGATQLPAPEAAATAQVAALPAGTNLLRAPIRQMERRLEALPWVRSARVGWLTQHAVRVWLKEREPAVVASVSGRRVEMDGWGVPIRIARPSAEKALPRVDVDRSVDVRMGVPLQDDALLAAIRIYRDAPHQQMARIAEINVDAAENMCLNMSDGLRVRLGQPEDLDAKMQYIQRVYELDPNVCSHMLSINLSVPKQPACTLKPVIHAVPAAISEKPAAPDAHPAGRDTVL